MTTILRPIHRWISLAAALFWLVQALTGIFIAFHWELDDASTPSIHRPVDVQAIGRRIQSLPIDHPGKSVAAIWASGGARDRFDLVVSDARTGASEYWRIDGGGNVLRRRSSGEMLARGGVFVTAVRLHQNLLASDLGRWIVALSGVLLLSNLLIALRLAWPLAGRWRKTLFPARAVSPAAALHGWHRALGLWAAAPAIVVVACGVLLLFQDDLARILGVEPLKPSAAAGGLSGAPPTSPGDALAIALARYPEATLSGMQTPSPEKPWYRVKLRQPGEARRVHGATTVFIDINGGRVIGDVDAFEMSAQRRFVGLLYPIHTGEIAGTAGRILAVLVGLWLILMTALGVAAWRARRIACGRRRAPAAMPPQRGDDGKPV